MATTARRRVIFGAVVAVVAWQGLHAWTHRSIHQPPGVLAPDEPLQVPLPADKQKLITLHDYQLFPVATFDIRARLLSREDYSNDRESEFAPLDFALGWGPMSDSAVLDQLEISQKNRFFWVEWPKAAPIPSTAIFQHSSNMHLIPASDDILEGLRRMRRGQVVHLRGRLVNVSSADGRKWVTSTRRDDTAAGACEVILVEGIY
jgi:hypothetical protein